MKTGLAISVCIVAVAVGLRLIDLREPTDQPTPASSSHNLQHFDLPDGLAAVYLPVPDPAQTAASTQPSFLILADACGRAVPHLPGGEAQEQADHAESVCQALLLSLSSGPWADGFIDDQIGPHEPFAESARQQFRVVQLAVDLCFRRHLEAGEYSEADALVRAQCEFGRRAYSQNVRLRGRQHGLALMRVGLQQAGEVAQKRYADDVLDEDAMAEITDGLKVQEDAIARVESAWSAKLRVVTSGRPNVADLVRIAEQDADRSFRVFATHQLGYARFERGEPGNQRLLTRAIQDARASDDPLIAAAGEASARLAREQFQTPPR